MNLLNVATIAAAAFSLTTAHAAIDLGAKYNTNRSGFDHGRHASAAALASYADAPFAPLPQIMECEYSQYQSYELADASVKAMLSTTESGAKGAIEQIFAFRRVFGALKTVDGDATSLRLVLANDLFSPAQAPSDNRGEFFAINLKDGNFGLAGYDFNNSVILREGANDRALYIRIHAYREEVRAGVGEHKIYVRCELPVSGQ